MGGKSRNLSELSPSSDHGLHNGYEPDATDSGNSHSSVLRPWKLNMFGSSQAPAKC